MQDLLSAPTSASRLRDINPWQWQEGQGWTWATESIGAGRVLYCAGQVPTSADGKVLASGDIRGQVEAALDNLETVLGAAGYGLGDVVRADYYTTDPEGLMSAWDLVKARYQKVGRQPGGVLLGVHRLAHPDLLIEIEAIAAR